MVISSAVGTASHNPVSPKTFGNVSNSTVIKDGGYLPEKGKPTEETVCYKIGGTYYEVSTSCGGSERLRDKVIQFIKSETVKPPNDKQG